MLRLCCCVTCFDRCVDGATRFADLKRRFNVGVIAETAIQAPFDVVLALRQTSYLHNVLLCLEKDLRAAPGGSVGARGAGASAGAGAGAGAGRNARGSGDLLDEVGASKTVVVTDQFLFKTNVGRYSNDVFVDSSPTRRSRFLLAGARRWCSPPLPSPRIGVGC